MASPGEKATDVDEDRGEEEATTPSPVDTHTAGADLAQSEDGAAPPTGVAREGIRWARSPSRAVHMKTEGINSGSEVQEVNPTISRRGTASPSPSYHHASHADYFALRIPPVGQSSSAKSRSRSPSTQGSSGSLQRLTEHVWEPAPLRPLRRAPSTVSNSSGARGRRVSHSKSASMFSPRSPNSEHPVYPDQSFASLQYQYHGPRPAPVLRSRSSNSSHDVLYNDTAVAPMAQMNRLSSSSTAKTAGNTPISSPGLFSPTSSRPHPSDLSGDDQSRPASPLLHPAHTQKPKVTNHAEVDRDLYTGNKYINEYEILEELGRGQFGKVKLGRRMGEETNVAIKIVPRYSRTRRLGKLGAPEDDTKREVAILKKARHVNVVSLLEVIDDPSKNKVYLVLEYVELGEIKWRKSAPNVILGINNVRFEREKAGHTLSLEPSEADIMAVAVARRRYEQMKFRERNAGHQQTPPWSLEHTADIEDDADLPEGSRSMLRLQPNRSHTPTRSDLQDDQGHFPETALAGSMYGAYTHESFHMHRARTLSIAASTASHMSSEFHFDELDEQANYVPTLTFEESRRAFQDTLLGLEFLHYLGIIHRDIKPMNLLVAGTGSVKISDFGVSYLGRPVSDEEETRAAEAKDETVDDEKELAKSVGTPGFWAPELCYDVMDPAQVAIFEKDGSPKISSALDLWSLGITLYCMVFARLPFYEGPDRSLYEAICKEEVFLPKTRLVPVDTMNPGSVTHTNYPMNSNKRLDYDLKFEAVSDSLRDLIRKLLIKDPSKRISVAEAKNHPWVLEGIADQELWMSVTNPDTKKKSDILDVDEKELSHAVVKRSIVERAISGVSRLAGNILGRREGRKRARSTATSTSASSDSIASPSVSSGSTIGRNEDSKESRKTSLRGDEVVAAALKASRENNEHPLAQSQSASPDEKEMPSYFTDTVNVKAASVGATPGPRAEPVRRPPGPERAVSSISTADSVKTIRASQYPTRASVLEPPEDIETSSLLDAATSNLQNLWSGAKKGVHGIRSRERRPLGDGRSPSAIRATSETDAHGGPSLAVSTAFASGDIETPEALRSELFVSSLSPSLFSPTYTGPERHASLFQPPISSDAAFEHAQALNRRRLVQEAQIEAEKAASRPESKAGAYECPPSPDDVTYIERVKAAADENSAPSKMPTLPSTSTIASFDGYDNSSVSQSVSDPSMGIVSSASSPPNDPFMAAVKGRLGYGNDDLPEFMRTADTITDHGRPAVATGLSLENQGDYDTDVDGEDDIEDDDSDDEGIVMMGPKKSK